jgi:hypothetical protein
VRLKKKGMLAAMEGVAATALATGSAAAGWSRCGALGQSRRTVAMGNDSDASAAGDVQ